MAPELVGFLDQLVADVRSQIAAATSPQTVVALVGAGSLYGLGEQVKVSALIERVQDEVLGRLLVFFPGEVDGNNYRLLGARDGWNYLATLITAEKRLTAVPLTNRDVFAHDPTKGDIPNLGVAKVKNPEDPGDWATLEWELRSFVCEGEYERGLERILAQFLSHLNQPEQPAAWVSGFFGSGKSHLMRVLEYLWRDYKLPSGASARDLAQLPLDIKAHLVELSTAAKRAGGLWSAAGTLGAGASGSVRLAFLGVIFDAAGLPRQYAPAQLAIWLKTRESIRAGRGSGERCRQVP